MPEYSTEYDNFRVIYCTSSGSPPQLQFPELMPKVLNRSRRPTRELRENVEGKNDTISNVLNELVGQGRLKRRKEGKQI